MTPLPEYGIGGQEVPKDASEAFADIPKNRTLFVQKLTDEDPSTPEMVYDLKNIDEVFEYFKPETNVEFETAEGASLKETLQFRGLADFGTKNITARSKFLQDLNLQQDQYQKIIKQLKTNKLLKSVLENPETRSAFLDALQSLAQELDEVKS